jgi:CheY-like chemotaxis protein
MTGAVRDRLLVATFDEVFAERVIGAVANRFQASRCEAAPDKLAAVLDGAAPDVCLIDLEDGKWDGTPNTELAAAARRRRDEIPIIVATHDRHLRAGVLRRVPVVLPEMSGRP